MGARMELPMKITMKPARSSIQAPALVAALMFLPMRFDDPTRPQGKVPVPLPGPLTGAPAGKDDPHVEMQRLFKKIEKDLRDIDRLLSDASAGGASTAAAEKKSADAIEGIDKLLQASEERGKAVVAGIDRILELADHPHPPGST
jgi:hypothetical protein